MVCVFRGAGLDQLPDVGAGQPGRGRVDALAGLVAPVRPDGFQRPQCRFLSHGNILAISAAVNAELAERGLDAVSRESVNRYTLRIEREGARIREINSAAEAFARRAGSIQDAGAGAYVKQLARTLLVDRLHEADSETPIKDLSQLVLAIRRIEGTSEQIDKRAKAAVEQAERESAARAEEAMRGEGLSDATIAAVRARILGAG
ncbi:MAG: DUF3486 family protein [Gammaproteobacteria bacterium]|nr:DUF3486 family protein [Gammaproteobacteria bacterium]